jgi:hypothetical protein
MIASMYKRREKVACIVFLSLVMFGGGFIAIMRPDTAEQWMESVLIIVPALMMLGMAIASRRSYNKVKDAKIPESNADITGLNHIVIKKDAAWLPKLLVFEKTGSFIGTVHLKKVPWWAYPVILYKTSSITFFPIEMVFTSSKGEVVFSCIRKGFKQSVVEIFGPGGEPAGTYIQEEFKSLVHIKGELRDNEGETLLKVKALDLQETSPFTRGIAFSGHTSIMEGSLMNIPPSSVTFITIWWRCLTVFPNSIRFSYWEWCHICF